MLTRLFNKEYAKIINDDGLLIKIKKIKLSENDFSWKGKTYNVVRNQAHRDTRQKYLGIITHYIYYYNVKNPNPLAYNKTSNAFEPLIDAELYNKLLEANILKKLNTVPFEMLKNLTPQQIIIGLLVIVAIGTMIAKGGVF